MIGSLFGDTLRHMENTEKKKAFLDRYQIEEIFESYEEYRLYLLKALATFQDMKKSRNPTLSAFVPEYLEIDFANIKSPRLYYPRYKGTIVVQFPEANLSPRQKGVIRSQKLIEFAALVKINEVAVGEQFAMRMKLLEPEKTRRRFKSRSRKSIDGSGT
ncbi:MAG: hypothetical protein ACXVBQ_14540 [Pseudobdellovibrionaceae bacterium]